MTETIQQTTCLDCGAKLINTNSGAICPHGHGKIWPRVDWQSVRKAERAAKSTLERTVYANKIVALPEATRRPDGYHDIEGKPGRWEWVRWCKIDVVVPKHCCLARVWHVGLFRWRA